jgi:hypothetical protein
MVTVSASDDQMPCPSYPWNHRLPWQSFDYNRFFVENSISKRKRKNLKENTDNPLFFPPLPLPLPSFLFLPSLNNLNN